MKDVSGGRLALEGIRQLPVACLELGEQAHVVDRDDRLAGEAPPDRVLDAMGGDLATPLTFGTWTNPSPSAGQHYHRPTGGVVTVQPTSRPQLLQPPPDPTRDVGDRTEQDHQGQEVLARGLRPRTLDVATHHRTTSPSPIAPPMIGPM
jgi:hypothetical protein